MPMRLRTNTILLAGTFFLFGLVGHPASAESQVQARQRAFDAMSPAQHLSAAEKLLAVPPSGPNLQQAKAHLNAIPAGAPERTAADKVSLTLRKAERAWASEQKQKAVSATTAQVTARHAYRSALRERFLDQGFDIKVETSGKNHTYLDLRFALFNDVWVHKFQKGDLIQEIRSLGFTKVRFRDGYDYSVDVTFDGR